MDKPYRVHEYDSQNHIADVILANATNPDSAVAAYCLPLIDAERACLLLNRGFAAGTQAQAERVKALEEALERCVAVLAQALLS